MSSGTSANSIRSLRLHLHFFFSLFSAAYLAESYQWQLTPCSSGVIFPCDPSSSSSSRRTSVLHEGLGQAPCRWQKHPCPHTAPRKGKGGWLRTSAAATPSAGDTARPPQRRRSPPGVRRLPRQPTAPPAPAPQREAWPPLLAPPRARAEGARLEPEPAQPVISRPEHDLAVVGVLPPFRLSRTSVPAGSLHRGKRHQSRSEARAGSGEQCSGQHPSRAINHPTRYNCACSSQF